MKNLRRKGATTFLLSTLMLMMTACGSFSASQALTTRQLAKEMDKLLTQYCEYAEGIANEELSMKQRTKIRTERMPELFINYERRYITVVMNEGRHKRTRTVKGYMSTKQLQAGRMHQNGTDTELYFSFVTTKDVKGLKWNLRGVRNDGTKVYEAVTDLYPPIVIQRKTGGRVTHHRVKGTRPAIITRIEGSGMDAPLLLGDINGAQRRIPATTKGKGTDK